MNEKNLVADEYLHRKYSLKENAEIDMLKLQESQWILYNIINNITLYYRYYWRVCVTLLKKIDRCPVNVPYTMLCYEDHYGELTGNPQPNPIGF